MASKKKLRARIDELQAGIWHTERERLERHVAGLMRDIDDLGKKVASQERQIAAQKVDLNDCNLKITVDTEKLAELTQRAAELAQKAGETRE